MEEMKDIVFLDSEIIEDDDDAPVGTLIRVLDDGTVEEIVSEQKAENQNELQDASDAAETALLDAETEQTATADDVAAVDSVAEVDETAQEKVDEQKVDEQNADVSVQADVAESTDDNGETVNDVISESESDANKATEETQPIAAIESDVNDAEEPVLQISEEQAAADSVSEVAQEQVQPAPIEKKPKTKRQPKAKAETEKVDTSNIQKSNINISNGETLNDTLHDTDFKIDQPTKPVSVVSTKKKQEKAEDLWAVAPVAQKKTPAKKQVEEEKAEQKSENKPAKSAEKSEPKTKKQPAKSTEQEKVAATKPEKKATASATQKKTSQKSVAEKEQQPKTAEKATVKAKSVKESSNSVNTTSPAKTAKVENKNTKAEAKMAKDTKVEKTEQTKKPTAKPATKPESSEKVLIAGDDSIPHGKFVIKLTDKGNYVYKLYSYNYRVVAIGAEQYSALPSCKGGIQSVIKNAANAPIEDLTLKNPIEQKCPKWVIYKDKKEEFRLRLIASNGNIVATTNDGYLSKDAAKKGIEAIARAAKGASVVRNDDLW